jgi:hypothetical protein
MVVHVEFKEHCISPERMVLKSSVVRMAKGVGLTRLQDKKERIRAREKCLRKLTLWTEFWALDLVIKPHPSPCTATLTLQFCVAIM